MNTSRKRLVGISLIFGVFLFAIAESALRILRFDEFPIFNIDREIGYVPKPNEAGVYAGKHLWMVNEASMQNGPFVADRSNGLLIISDSLTWGGVSAYNHSEKLGPALERVFGGAKRVWSVGAGSWSLLNELTYLDRHPDVVRGVADIVILSNSGDFTYRSQSTGELTHPSSRPIFISVYLFRKYISQFLPSTEGTTRSSALIGPTKEVAEAALKWLRHNQADGGPRVIFIWYPNKAELINPQSTRALRDAVEKMVTEGGANFRVIGPECGWSNIAVYKDEIHPTFLGNDLLAKCIANMVRETRP